MGSKEDLFTSIPCEDEDDLDAVTALYEGVLYAIGQRRAAWLNERLRDIARGATATAYCEHGAVTGEPCVQCELDLPPAAEAVVVTERAWSDFNDRTKALAVTMSVLVEITSPDEAEMVVSLTQRILQWSLAPIATFVRLEA